jgi:hypothetical protein
MPAHSSTNYEQAIYTYVSEEPEPVEEPDLEDPDEDPEAVDLEPSLPETHLLDKARLSLDVPALGFAQCRAREVPQELGESVNKRPNILVVLHQADELVEAFASHVNRVGPVRRRKFHDTAYQMLMHDRRPIDEIIDVVDHAFTHAERLAYEMDDADDTINGWDRGLTRLRQVRDFYDDIRADMARAS